MHALRQYGTEYIAVEDAAHQAHKGMWQGPFEMPADWRKDQKIDRLLAQRGQSLQPQGDNGYRARFCTRSCAVMLLWLSGYYSSAQLLAALALPSKLTVKGTAIHGHTSMGD